MIDWFGNTNISELLKTKDVQLRQSGGFLRQESKKGMSCGSL